ncbi:Hypothetical protein I595_2282 [Croceitalea dokdonensis DOKDO 023]|uniref:Uncharacterized protein n=1 Tax=Croceitalea dokdonensis DOKDO 023 TaxID=1300341 RepID=A0A0P7AV94_9FLAO|nr:Hypothetical protein I595_2282 [Croceitalea dokdonensis DOKDO 023]
MNLFSLGFLFYYVPFGGLFKHKQVSKFFHIENNGFPQSVDIP